MLTLFLSRSRKGINLAVEWVASEMEDQESARILGVGRTPILVTMLESWRVTQRRFDDLVERLPTLDSENANVRQHGLAGSELLFKLMVAEYQIQEFEQALETPESRHWSARGPIKKAIVKMIDAIDALLDSLIGVIGAGGAIKEFKDALRAFVE